jgi:hypothetical protein
LENSSQQDEDHELRITEHKEDVPRVRGFMRIRNRRGFHRQLMEASSRVSPSGIWLDILPGMCIVGGIP